MGQPAESKKFNNKCIVVHMHTVYVFIAIFLKLVQAYSSKIYNKAILVSITPVLKNDEKRHFSKRSGAATKGLEFCELWLQMAFFNLNAVLYVLG